MANLVSACKIEIGDQKKEPKEKEFSISDITGIWSNKSVSTVVADPTGGPNSPTPHSRSVTEIYEISNDGTVRWQMAAPYRVVPYSSVQALGPGREAFSMNLVFGKLEQESLAEFRLILSAEFREYLRRAVRSENEISYWDNNPIIFQVVDGTRLRIRQGETATQTGGMYFTSAGLDRISTDERSRLLDESLWLAEVRRNTLQQVERELVGRSFRLVSKETRRFDVRGNKVFERVELAGDMLEEVGNGFGGVTVNEKHLRFNSLFSLTVNHRHARFIDYSVSQDRQSLIATLVTTQNPRDVFSLSGLVRGLILFEPNRSILSFTSTSNFTNSSGVPEKDEVSSFFYQLPL